MCAFSPWLLFFCGGGGGGGVLGRIPRLAKHGMALDRDPAVRERASKHLPKSLLFVEKLVPSLVFFCCLSRRFVDAVTLGPELFREATSRPDRLMIRCDGWEGELASHDDKYGGGTC